MKKFPVFFLVVAIIATCLFASLAYAHDDHSTPNENRETVMMRALECSSCGQFAVHLRTQTWPCNSGFMDIVVRTMICYNCGHIEYSTYDDSGCPHK